MDDRDRVQAWMDLLDSFLERIDAAKRNLDRMYEGLLHKAPEIGWDVHHSSLPDSKMELDEHFYKVETYAAFMRAELRRTRDALRG